MRIGVLRTDDTHVDTTQGGGLQREEHGVVGQEVRRLDIQVATGSKYGAHEALHDFRIGRRRAAGDNLCDAVVGDTRQGWVVAAVGDERSVDEVPVDEERALQTVHHAARQPQHGVAPRLSARPLHIAQGDVHATNVAHLSVDDNQFAVVAVVGLAGERGEMHGQVRHHLDTVAAHGLEERAVYLPAAHIVVDDTHLDTLLGFLSQCVGNKASQRIVLDDVHVDMDVVARLADVLQQLGEEGVAVGHDVDGVVLERQRHALVDKQVDELSVVVGYAEVVLFDKAEHGALGQLVERALADESLAPVVDAEEEVEDDADDGNEEDDQRPRHRLRRLAVVHDDVDNRQGNEYPREGGAYDVE